MNFAMASVKFLARALKRGARICAQLNLIRVERMCNQTRHALLRAYLRRTVFNTVARRMWSSDAVRTRPAEEGTPYVFSLWLQGSDSIPPIVEACIESVRHNWPEARLIVLDQDSVHDWITVDNAIQVLYANGKIGPAHYSDVVRFLLLQKYGGYWLDATIYLAEPVCGDLDKFWTLKRPSEPLGSCVSQQRWTSYALGGPPQHPIWSFMVEFYREYWSRHDAAVDYLIIDYALDYAYEQNIADFGSEVDVLGFSNLGVWNLGPHLNDPCQGDWRRADWASGTELFKLSHKESVLRSWLDGQLPREETRFGESVYGSIRSIVPGGSST